MASPNFSETDILAEKGRKRTLISVLFRHILFDKTVGDNLKNLNHFPGGADSTTGNWKIMSPFKISAFAGMTEKRNFRLFTNPTTVPLRFRIR